MVRKESSVDKHKRDTIMIIPNSHMNPVYGQEEIDSVTEYIIELLQMSITGIIGLVAGYVGGKN